MNMCYDTPEATKGGRGAEGLEGFACLRPFADATTTLWSGGAATLLGFRGYRSVQRFRRSVGEGAYDFSVVGRGDGTPEAVAGYDILYTRK